MKKKYYKFSIDYLLLQNNFRNNQNYILETWKKYKYQKRYFLKYKENKKDYYYILQEENIAPLFIDFLINYFIWIIPITLVVFYKLENNSIYYLIWEYFNYNKTIIILLYVLFWFFIYKIIKNRNVSKKWNLIKIKNQNEEFFLANKNIYYVQKYSFWKDDYFEKKDLSKEKYMFLYLFFFSLFFIIAPIYTIYFYLLYLFLNFYYLIDILFFLFIYTITIIIVTKYRYKLNIFIIIFMIIISGILLLIFTNKIESTNIINSNFYYFIYNIGRLSIGAYLYFIPILFLYYPIEKYNSKYNNKRNSIDQMF